MPEQFTLLYGFLGFLFYLQLIVTHKIQLTSLKEANIKHDCSSHIYVSGVFSFTFVTHLTSGVCCLLYVFLLVDRPWGTFSSSVCECMCVDLQLHCTWYDSSLLFVFIFSVMPLCVVQTLCTS